MQLVEVFDILGGGGCVGAAMLTLIKTANKLISRLHNKHYPMSLSPEDELANKNKNMCWVCKRKSVDGSRETPVCDHNDVSNPILLERGGSSFRELAHKSWNLKTEQQYFLLVYKHNSN